MPAKMLTSFEIRGFRAFAHLKLTDLGRVNLFVGKNNVGKSSLLEALWVHAESAVDSIPADERRFPAVQTAKAKLHTFLAWQEEPGKPIGQAVTAKYLNPNAPQAAEFIQWLRALFIS